MAVNLLPWRTKRAERKLKLLYSVLTLVLIMAMVIIYFYQQQLEKKISKYEARNKNLLQQINSIKPATNLSFLNTRIETLNNQIALNKAVSLTQKSFWWQWRLLQKYIPYGLNLTEIHWKIHEIQLQGTTCNLRKLTLCLLSLETCPQFLSVALENITAGTQKSTFQFTIRILTNEKVHAN